MLHLPTGCDPLREGRKGLVVVVVVVVLMGLWRCLVDGYYYQYYQGAITIVLWDYF